MAVVKMVALTMFGPHEEMEPVAREMVLSGGFQPLPIDFLVGDRSIRSKVTTESDNPYDDLLNKMTDRKSKRLNSSHSTEYRMPSSA